MAYLMVIFGVWLVWNLLLTFFGTPDWFPYLASILLGIGGQCLIDVDHWWYGVGLAGAANFLLLIGDVLLVTTDALKTGVLRRTGRSR